MALASLTAAVIRGGDLDAEVDAEAESPLHTFGSAAATLRRSGRKSPHAVQNLNDGDCPLGRTFVIETAETADGTGTPSIRVSHVEGAPKSGDDDASGTADLTLTVPVRYVPVAP